MDWTVLVGLLLAVGAIMVSNFMDGGSLSGLLNSSALILILGGTLGATLVSCGSRAWSSVLPALRDILGPVPKTPVDLPEKFAEWAQIARRDGLLALEDKIRGEKDRYLMQGMQAVIDGYPQEAVRELLDTRAYVEERRLEEAAHVLEVAGGFSPTIGIIGTVLGLTHVLKDLSDVHKIGVGIATAFMATFYGVALANLLWLPLSNKAKAVAAAMAERHAVIRDGVLAIQNGDTPTVVRQRLMAYVGGTAVVRGRGGEGGDA